MQCQKINIQGCSQLSVALVPEIALPRHKGPSTLDLTISILQHSDHLSRLLASDCTEGLNPLYGHVCLPTVFADPVRFLSNNFCDLLWQSQRHAKKQ